MITPQSPAVLVRDFPGNKIYILTGYDVSIECRSRLSAAWLAVHRERFSGSVTVTVVPMPCRLDLERAPVRPTMRSTMASLSPSRSAAS